MSISVVVVELVIAPTAVSTGVAAVNVVGPLKAMAPDEFNVQLSLVALEAASVRALFRPVVLTLTVCAAPAAVVPVPVARGPRRSDRCHRCRTLPLSWRP